jgi:para-nitrobenzyl esterase
MHNANRLSTIVGAALALGAIGATAPAPIGRTVPVDGGAVDGAPSGDVLAFKGIPFAAPPLGALRWRAPQPVVPWKGVRDASRFGHDCMQVSDPNEAGPPGTKPAEDCLVLNVWRPPAPAATLPVLVWIPGGGYVNGGSSTPIYDGAALAKQGLVVVSINYRLGRFGFFAHPALVAAKEGPTGNFGLMDQIAALRWVRRNIAAFGGDPEQVTVAGESAGGDAVMHLLTSPEAKGLFQRAIVMSGDGRTPLLGGVKLTGGTPQSPSADQIGAAFAASVGVSGGGPEALAALRALPADVIAAGLNMSALVKMVMAPAPPSYVMGPIVDGAIVVASPAELIASGRGMQVPLLVGTTSQDMPTRFPPSKADPLACFGADAAKARGAYDPEGRISPQATYLSVGVDLTMHEPARFVAKQLTMKGAPVWLYRFSYVAESRRGKVAGATHASELPFAFGTLAAVYGARTTAKDRETARAFNAYLGNFARTGNPNAAGLPEWPPFDPAKFTLMNFTVDRGPAVEPDPLQTRVTLVERADACRR